MPTTGTAGYEFSADENRTFEQLVRNMWRSGLLVVVASLVLLAYHFVDYFGVSLGKEPAAWVVYLDYAAWFLISLIGVVIGVLLVRATTGFAALIRTEGDDVKHLMDGMTKLSGILGLVSWAAAGASALLAVSFAVLLTYS
jgi:hypothetical protein